jgi:hypothetical protein
MLVLLLVFGVWAKKEEETRWERFTHKVRDNVKPFFYRSARREREARRKANREANGSGSGSD